MKKHTLTMASNLFFFFSFFCLFLFLFPISGTSSSFASLRLSDEGVEMVVEKLHDEVARISMEGKGGEQGNRSTLILAAERTRRKDIFNHFQRYTGGWNISNPYYISSLLSTAVPFFAVTVCWFVIFGIFLFLFCFCSCCCCNNEEPHDYSKSLYAFSLIFLILCTIAAIAGCVILYTGQGRFHGNTSKTLNYIANQAYFTAHNLMNISKYFDSVKQIVVGVGLPSDFDNTINHVQTKINNAATILSNQTEDNSKILHQIIDRMGLSLIIVVAVILFVAFLGFLFSIFGLPPLVYFLVVIGWILVVGTFILCGAFLFLHNAIGDTCVAMDEWVMNPKAHTALDKILPCVENATVLETSSVSKAVTQALVQSVDQFISIVTNGNKIHYNQSGPHTPLLCNPFNHDLTNRHCKAGEVSLDKATEVWKNYTCKVRSGNCITRGRLTPPTYTQITAAVNVTYGLYRYGPFLVELVDCNFVRKTFADISRNYCPALRLYTKWIYFGSLVVSVAVMLSLLFWIVFVRQQRSKKSMELINNNCS